MLGKATSDLVNPVGVTVTLYDEGAEWIEPAVFRDVRPGAELVAFSKLRGASSSQVGMTWDEGMVKVGGRKIDRQLKGKVLADANFGPLFRARSLSRSPRIARETARTTVSLQTNVRSSSMK